MASILLDSCVWGGSLPILSVLGDFQTYCQELTAGAIITVDPDRIRIRAK